MFMALERRLSNASVQRVVIRSGINHFAIIGARFQI